ncbi:MAG: hypothetical protein IPI01_14470 [Ignavibacteriae bacterium]|nr:hypothetical protein [Ignavibacteriota bacterium]
MKTWWAVRILKGLFIGAVIGLVVGFVVMGLWNALIPELFHGPVITFWQAVGLLVLSHILFRGPGGRFGGWRHDRWRKKFETKLAAMTPEEREKFRNQWHHWCYPWDDGGKEQPAAGE